MAKRENDARFLKSEKLMIGAATEEIGSGRPVTITSICQRAGIFTSTFYRHYRSINELVETCSENLLQGFNVLLNEVDKERLSMEKLFKKWAWFIYQNREAFMLSILMDQKDLLLSMMRELRPVATLNWRSSPQKTAKVYLIYSYEVIGIWMNWAKQEKFNIDKIVPHAQELNFLTRTALQRLGGLASD